VPPGPLRLLIATPHFHHRHHQRGGAVANFASLLPIIDVAFGSHSDEASRSFGVERKLPDSFVGLLLAPFRRRDRVARDGGYKLPVPPAAGHAVAVNDTVSI